MEDEFTKATREYLEACKREAKQLERHLLYTSAGHPRLAEPLTPAATAHLMALHEAVAVEHERMRAFWHIA
jgi:hypothetical protein